MGYSKIDIIIKREDITNQAVIISEHIDDKYEDIIGTTIRKNRKMWQYKCEEKLTTLILTNGVS